MGVQDSLPRSLASGWEFCLSPLVLWSARCSQLKGQGCHFSQSVERDVIVTGISLLFKVKRGVLFIAKQYNNKADKKQICPSVCPRFVSFLGFLSTRMPVVQTCEQNRYCCALTHPALQHKVSCVATVSTIIILVAMLWSTKGKNHYFHCQKVPWVLVTLEIHSANTS